MKRRPRNFVIKGRSSKAKLPGTNVQEPDICSLC
jgi:hypothetical protein